MTEHDLLEVVALEEMCNLSPWGWDAYHTELQSAANSLMLVARAAGSMSEAERPIVGFIVARELAEEIHINNVAVKPEFRSRGLGSMLLKTALAWGRERRARQAVLEVRAGNNMAHQLYRGCGFEVIGRRRRYYKSPVEDALLMAVSLEQTP
ncbi:MAG: ribosomal protein S18-alanine N-acetyltransferase [Acidobacteriota bacterium]